MTLTLTRTAYTPNGVFGVLTSEGGMKLADTLEHAYAADDPRSGPNCLQDQPKVPVGTYTCIRYLSPKRGYVVWMLQDVPGHDHIEIHIANKQEELDGCIAIGQPVDNTMIIHSKDTFKAFMTLTQNLETFTLVVTNQGDV